MFRALSIPPLLSIGILACLAGAVQMGSSGTAGAVEIFDTADHPTSRGDQMRFEEGVAAYDAGDYPLALSIWLPMAQRGDLAAQRNVAHLFRKGLGTEVDLDRALYFYERAADAGLTSAALNAGMMRADPDQPFYNADKAANWLKIASAAESPIAQWRLADLYEAGEGVEQSPGKAQHLRQQAVALGFRPPETAPAPVPAAVEPIRVQAPRPNTPQAVSPDQGARYMQGLYAFDRGAYREALSHWAPLAEDGVSEALYRTGLIYRFGLGVEIDLNRARLLLQEAADSGHGEAASALVSLP